VVRIVFPFGSMKVGEEGAKNIETAAARLNAGGVSAKITGHADSVGKADTNRRVALARAHAVANALLAKGVKPALLVVDAEGAEAPVASNRSTEGRAQNRRVDIELIAK
jgi:OOP family OmpA-OmpF porin